LGKDIDRRLATGIYVYLSPFIKIAVRPGCKRPLKI
jgi:hypothetical protein